MSWFIFGKKKSSLGCGCQAGSTEVSGRGFMCAEDGVCGCDVRHGGACRVLVLGAGCKSCRVLYENVKGAVCALGLAWEVEYVTEMAVIAQYGVMSMPAIVVDEKVVSAGKVLSSQEVERLFHRLGY